MAINRFVVLALVFVAMVAYVSGADTLAAEGTSATSFGGAGAPAGAPDAAAGIPGGDAGAPAAGGAGGATSGGDSANGDAPSFKASGVYAIVAAVVVVGCFF